jgi:RNA polymerase sigma-70 factor (ECF subfamily)
MRIAAYLRAWKNRPPGSGNGLSSGLNFKEVALPHLRASYRLARWLTRDHDEAEEVVQEAYLTAFKRFESYNGGDAQAWILAIVRNTFYSSLRRHRADEDVFDEEHYCSDSYEANAGTALPDTNPEAILLRQEEMKLVRAAIEALPVALREVLVLRTFDELSYNEIAEITDIPIGTVMSRLARARRHLLKRLGRTRTERK